MRSCEDTGGGSFEKEGSTEDKAVELEKTLAGITAELKKYPAAMPGVHVTSAFKKLGIEQLRADLVQLATAKPLG